MRRAPCGYCGCAPDGVLLPISRVRISESKVIVLTSYYRKSPVASIYGIICCLFLGHTVELMQELKQEGERD